MNSLDMNNAELSDDELLRYSRQIMLPQWDVSAQLKIKTSRVLIVGCGGLGSPVAMYLASAGVGELLLADDDQVEQSNLQRQIVHDESRLGRNKAVSAVTHLNAMNSNGQYVAVEARLSGERLSAEIAGVDLVLDCSDNFLTRQEVNRYCVKHKKPLVSGAAIRMEGQISVFDFARSDSPCYHCLYDADTQENLSCSEAGVLSPLVGLIGSYQAMEALKVLAGVGDSLVGRVQLFDGMKAQWREFKLNKDPECAVCAKT